MAVGFDPNADFETITDGLEPVTLVRRGSSDDTAITNALQRNINNNEIAQSDGKYMAGDVRWHLPDAEVREVAHRAAGAEAQREYRDEDRAREGR